MKHIEENRNAGPIGVFDSGYGGLSVLREIQRRLPQYDYLYLGDNARAPYGTRSFEIVYKFTLEAVKYMFERGCRLVILACNTASAKALRSIQQNDLPELDPTRRVLGVIRPTVEKVGEVTQTGHIGLVGTPGTVKSGSYEMEIAKLHPDYCLYSQPCPMWVPLVEYKEFDSPGADYFVKQELDRLMSRQQAIDTLILGCTHYPLLYDKIVKYVPAGVKIISQGKITADSLADYLKRHPEMEVRCSKGGVTTYMTTENPEKFADLASVFLDRSVEAVHADISSSTC
ncbi:MAG: glutamate racemase [Muribaculum sp.]|nr:glutamate racemase [Muribaculum sp.]